MKNRSHINFDIRLDSAFERIDQGVVEVLSLDIFDTLLWRKVPLPQDVFVLLGNKLKREGWLVSAVPAEAFIDFRMNAEKIARTKKKESTEVNLREIYWELSGLFVQISIEQMVEGVKGITDPSDVDDLISIELDIEKQLLQFDDNIVNLIEYAHNSGVKVVLVSNTYFSQDNIETFLKFRPEVYQLISDFFISSEYGVGKEDGLFAKMIEKLTIAPDKILHIGDHFELDYKKPKTYKIPTIYYPKYDDHITECLNREWEKSDVTIKQALLDDYEGDFGLTSLRSKLCYQRTNTNVSDDDTFFWKYGATVLGPCLAGFTHWVYDRCKELNETKVFCLMREGRLYHQMINAYAPYYPQHAIDSKELWLSRRFTTSACIFYGTAEEIFSATKSPLFSPFTVEEFCQYLGIDISKAEKLLTMRFVKLSEPEVSYEVSSYLSGHEELKDQIIQNSAEKRKRLLHYLSGFVDLSKTNQLTLIDIGWAGTIQGALQAILQLSGYETKVNGLYLATSSSSQMALMKGFNREGYLFQAGFPEAEYKVAFEGHYALEQSATTGLGPLIDITEDGEIITDDIQINSLQEKQSSMMQKGILDFCHVLGRHTQKTSWKPDSEKLIAQLRNILVKAAGRPTRAEAKAMGEWYHDHVSGKDTSLHVLGKNEYYERYIKDMLPTYAYKDLEVAWPAAYAAQQSKYLAQTAFVSRSKIIPRKCLLSLDQIPFAIYIDYGKGFSSKPTSQLSLRSNANRSFYAYEKITSTKKPIKKIRLELLCPDSFIRITSLRMRLDYMDTPETEILTFFGEDTHETRIDCSYPKKEEGLFTSEKAPLVLTHSFEKPNIYLVQVDICFSTFPI